MAGLLDSIEDKCNEFLLDKAPVQLPKEWRSWLATYAWVFALIGLVMGVILFLPLLAVIGLVSVWGVAFGAGGYVVVAWLSLIVLATYLTLLGLAVPKLRRMEKGGWNLLFYGALLFLVYDVFQWLRTPNLASFFGLIWNMAWAVAGLYVIFQIRSYFLKVKAGPASRPKK